MVSNLASVRLFSIFEICAFLTPTNSPNCVCVKCFSSLIFLIIIKSTIQLSDQPFWRFGGEDAGGIPLSDTPQKQVDDPAKVGVVIEARYPALQSALHRQGVDHILQVIIASLHGYCQSGRMIVFDAVAPVVGFPVEDVILAIVFKQQVNIAVPSGSVDSLPGQDLRRGKDMR